MMKYIKYLLDCELSSESIVHQNGLDNNENESQLLEIEKVRSLFLFYGL